MSLSDVLTGKRQWHIECSDVLDGLRQLPDGVVQCCVTSPPYFALRSYMPDMVQLASGITPEERERITAELTRLGIMPLDLTAE